MHGAQRGARGAWAAGGESALPQLTFYPFYPSPHSPPQNDEDEDMVDFVHSLHTSAVLVWEGFVQMLEVREGKPNSAAEGAAALAYFSPAALQGKAGGAEDICKRLGSWATEWQAAFEGPDAREQDLELVTKCVGLVGDIAKAFHLQNVGPLLMPFGVALMWLTTHCHEREKNDGVAAAHTTANTTRELLSQPKLP